MSRYLLAWMGGAILALSGCAACPPMKAGWYLLDQGVNEMPELWIGLVNEGESTTLRKVSVNPTKDDGSGVWHFDFEGKEMKSGQIVLLNATTKGLPTCMVPVRMSLQCANASRLGWVPVTGSLPNYVPQYWLAREECRELRGSSS